MAEGWGGVKVTGPTEGRVMAGMDTGPVAKGWPVGRATVEKAWLGREVTVGPVVKVWPVGGVTVGNGWPGGSTRTDLETSSNQRSASDGVRLWEGMRTGEEVGGGTTITGVGADQLLTAGTKAEKNG